MENKKVTEVVAALIVKDGRFLICRRPPQKKRGLLWEFVGGKVEEGETKEDALKRECREELDVGISVGRLFSEVLHEYPDLTVRLSVYEAEICDGAPKMLEHCGMVYITPDEIDNYDFCPADTEILKKIKEEMI